MNVIKRLSYIDVAKGLLILLVVYDHLPDMYMYKLNMSNEYIEYLDKTQWVYKLFFMPAFFCITGMCSNFNKDFKTFFISNYKSLIIPNVILGMILKPTWLGGVILHGGCFWFLSALFVAKMIYFCVCKYIDKPSNRILLLLLLVCIGFALNSMRARYDIWYFHYAFCLCIFLELGRVIKEMRNRQLLVMSTIYIILSIVLSIMDVHKPIVAAGCNSTLDEVPLYLIMAFTGSCFTIWISKLIDANTILEFFGKESLIFYVFQFSVMIEVEKIVLRYYAIQDMGSALLFTLAVYIITVILLSLISMVIETKYFSFLVGKFRL